MNVLTFVAVDKSGKIIEFRMTREEAIASAKASAALKGHTYADDEDALQDFMVIHWAKWEEADSK